MSNFEGQQIGNFLLQTKLGEGGMGEVYSAMDVQLQRAVAVKVMHPHVARHEIFERRFLQEARSSASLDHPNIVRIYTFDVAPNGVHYLVMEFVQSGSLRNYLDNLRVQRTQIETTEALNFIMQVASALDYAHALNIVHRDVKPDNVLLKQATTLSFGVTSFTAVLTDFGLAKIVNGENLVQTQMNNPLGTLPYMAPEQFTGQVDARADLYALGIMMYEMLVGRLPFMPTAPHEAGRMHMHEPPPPPRSFRPDLLPALEPIILKAIAKQPDHRFQAGRELIQVINQVLGGGTSLGGPMASYGGQPSAYGAPQPQYSPPPVATGVPQILLEREGYASKMIPITRDIITIGRDPKRDLPIAGDKVSRMHAQIERENDGSFLIIDKSTNGTFMNGQRIEHDEAITITGPLTIGPYRLTIVVK